MSSPSLIGRDPFAKASAEVAPLVLQLAQEAMADAKRRAPQWRKFGLRLIELVEPSIAARNDELEKQYFEEVARKGKKRGKKAGKTSLKWPGHVSGGGFGSPVKTPNHVAVPDEDDEEELPVGLVKEEGVLKAESDDDMTMKAESDGE